MTDRKNPPGKQPPGIVQCVVGINCLVWDRYATELENLQQDCPHIRLSGRCDKDSPDRAPHQDRDIWGCLWSYPGMGLAGQAIEFPLDDWAKLKDWKPPSTAEPIEQIRKNAAQRTASSPEEAWHGSLDHGFIFLRLTYLRGFSNFMIDVAEENPDLYRLCDIVTDYWYEITKAHLDCGATLVGAGDDLGLQDRLPISPESWRKLIKPAYRRIFSLVRERGAGFALHTDGYIVDIIPDLIEAGLTQLNPQDLVNGLDNLVRLAKGRVHIALDIDRQKITAFGTPEQVAAHIKTCIETLGSPEGGLTLVFGVYPGTPIENVQAAVRAMEKYHDWWVQ